MNEPEFEYLVDAFAGLSEMGMREAGLDAIRAHLDGYSPSNPATEPMIPWQSWALRLLETLPGEQQATETMEADRIDMNRVRAFLTVDRNRYRSGTVQSHEMHMLRFWNWMEGAGYALAFHNANGDLGWVFTALGIRRLESEHPCRPGALERLRGEFGDSDEDSLARLEDAFECFERGLMRPAIVLLGLSFEELTRDMFDRLGLGKQPGAAAWRQNRIREHLEKTKAHKTKEGTAALSALNTADSIRDNRNDAIHMASGSWNPVEVDELLTDGIRAFPKLARYRPPTKA